MSGQKGEAVLERPTREKLPREAKSELSSDGTMCRVLFINTSYKFTVVLPNITKYYQILPICCGKMSASDLSSYRDQHFKGSRGDHERLLHNTSTLYVGNMSYYTTEEQIYELFGKCCEVKRVVMGLDKFKRTPCEFCFVEYYVR